MSDAANVQAQGAVDPLILAIDVGTSSARALVYDGRARVVDTWEAHRPYQVRTTEDGGVEADAGEIVDLVASCLDEVLPKVQTASREIAAIACDTFWHSLMGVGGDAKPLTPVYTWADTRSRHAAKELRGRLDERAVHARTGAVLHSSYLPAKIQWLRDTAPDLVDRVRYWMSLAEYLYLELFGERRVSISMASGSGLFDQKACTWDDELLEALHIHEEQLSPLAEYSDALRGLRKGYAERWPALANISWLLPLGDGACNNVGSGGYCEEWAVLMVGTSGALRIVREATHLEIPRGLWTYRVDRRRVVQGGALSDGGNVFAWLTDNLRVDPPADLEGEIASLPPDSHGLTILPFLAGERSPNWHTDARAALVGMTLDTKAVHIVRASLEAIAYRFAAVFDIVREVIPESKGFIASGAALAHSPIWVQIMSDVLGQPIVTSAAPEATSRGAALLVLEALGAVTHLGDLPAPLGQQHAPIAEHARTYRAAIERQQRLYGLLIEDGHA